MKKFILLITIVASVVGIQRARAETDLLPEGRYWNYELYGRRGMSDYVNKTLNDCHFEGTETIGEYTYKIFKDGDGNNLGLLRQEGLKIYRYFDEKMREGGLYEYPDRSYNPIEYPEEVLLYDLGLVTEEAVEVVRLEYGYDPVYNYPNLQIEMVLSDLDYLEIDKIKCERQYTYNETEFSPDIKSIIVAGIGPMDGILSAPSISGPIPANGSHYEPWKIVDVRDSEGNVIFRYNDFYLPDGGVAGIPPKFSEDWIWEYYTRYSEKEHGMIRMKFDGTEEIGGKSYQIFKTISDLRWEGTEDHNWKDVTEVKSYEVPSEVSYLRLEDRCVWRLFEAGTEIIRGTVTGDVPFEGTLAEPMELCLLNQAASYGEDKLWLVNVAPGKWEWNKGILDYLTIKYIGSIPHDQLEIGFYFKWLTDIGPVCGGTLGVPEPANDILDIFQNFIGTVFNALYNSENEQICKNFCYITLPEVGAVGYLQDDADAQPEYFTLDGLRVAAPRSGQLLIRRQGANVKKVLIR